jgi:hypothetical protein
MREQSLNSLDVDMALTMFCDNKKRMAFYFGVIVEVRMQMVGTSLIVYKNFQRIVDTADLTFVEAAQ